MSKRVAVVGTGVIGGSIALRLSQNGTEVSAFDVDPATRDHLEAVPGIEVADSPSAAAGRAQAVIIAVPVDRIVTVAGELSGLESSVVVTDVGSSKGPVVTDAGAALGPRFVGGHPMAGSERHGFGAADPSMFEDAPWILTPVAGTSSEAYRVVSGLVASLGARPVALDPEAHDRLIARLSHLPQLAASAVVNVAATSGNEDALLGLAAGGFRDVTRIAASHPGVWVPILRANRQGVLEALEAFGADLAAVTAMLREERWDDLATYLESARDARLSLFVRPDHSDEPVTLTLLIPDRPGVLAEVTTAAGELGANIEDLEIFHSTEGGKGRLGMVVTGRAPAAALTERLEALGYHVELGLPE